MYSLNSNHPILNYSYKIKKSPKRPALIEKVHAILSPNKVSFTTTEFENFNESL